MVLILAGNLGINAHVRGNISYYICLMHIIGSRAAEIGFSKKSPIFFHACATRSQLPSNISTITSRYQSME